MPVAEPAVDQQRLPAAAHRVPRLARIAVRDGQVRQGARLPQPVAGATGELAAAPLAPGGPAGLAEPGARQAEQVQRGVRQRPSAGGPVQLDAAHAVGDRVGVQPAAHLDQRQVVQRHAFAVPVAQPADQHQVLLDEGGRLGELAALGADQAEVVQGPAQPERVVQAAEQREASPQVRLGGREPAAQVRHGAELQQCQRRGVVMAGPTGRRHGSRGELPLLIPVPVAVHEGAQVGHEGGGEHRVDAGHLQADGDDGRPLPLQPRQRGIRRGEPRGGWVFAVRGVGGHHAGRAQQAVGMPDPGQVVPGHPAQRRVGVRRRVVRTGQLAGEQAQERQQAVPAGLGRLQQVHVNHLLEGTFGVVCRAAGEGGRHRYRHLGRVDDAEQAEQPGGEPVAGQRRVADLEAAAYRQAAGRQLRHPPLRVAQPVGQGLHRPPWTAGQPDARDAHGQWQPRADSEHLAGRRRLRADPLGSGDALQHGQRFGGRQRTEAQRPCAGQRGQPGPAGDQHGAAARSGQQRLDLGGVQRVVEHDEHPAAGQQGTQHRRAPVRQRRDAGGLDTEVREEPGQHLLGSQRSPAGALQVDVELPVREPRPAPVGGVQGERGLADAGRPGHHGDQRRPRAFQVQPPAQRCRLGRAAAEVGQVGRQLGRRSGRAGRRGGRCRRQLQRRVGGQDLVVQAPQLAAGLDAEVLGQRAAGVVEDGQGFGLPARAVQGEHLQGAHPFPVRVQRGQPGQLRHPVGVLAEAQPDLDTPFEHGQPQLDQALPLGGGERAGHPVEGLPAPEPQRVVERDRRRQPGVAERLGHQLPEDLQVELVGRHVQDVPGRRGHEHGATRTAAPARLDDPPQPRHVRGDQVGRAARHPLAPHPVDDLVPGHRPVRLEQQHREDGPLLGRSEVELDAGPVGADGTEHAERQLVRHQPAPFLHTSDELSMNSPPWKNS